MNNLEMRDYIDSHREVSPLTMAKDARLLDNTQLSSEQTFREAFKWAQEKIKGSKVRT
jgi:cytidylate kinase